MPKQLGNIINNCFDVTAASEPAVPFRKKFVRCQTFPVFSRGRRQRCSDWQRYKKEKRGRGQCEKATDDGELMNVIIACIGCWRQQGVVVAVCSLWPKVEEEEVEKVEEEGRTLGRLPTHRRRTLACESCCCWLPCALKFDPAKLPILRVRQTQVYLSKEIFLGVYGQSCGDMYTEYCLDMGNT